MNRSLRFTVLSLALVAFSGCGDAATEPRDTAPTAATGPGSTGLVPPTPPTGATAGSTPPKLSSTSKRFAAKLDSACRRYDTSEAEVYYSDAVASGEDPSTDLKEMVSSYKALIRTVEKLEPPAESEQNFDAYVASLRALVESDPSVETLNARNEAAIKLGAENCIMDSAD